MLFSRASLLFSVALGFSATFAFPVAISPNGLVSRSVEDVIVSRQATGSPINDDCDEDSDPSCALNKCVQQCNFGGSGFSIEACTKACSSTGTGNSGVTDTNGNTDATSGSGGSSTIDCDTNINDPACAIQVCVNNCLAGKSGENAQQCSVSCSFTGPGNSTATDSNGNTDATGDSDTDNAANTTGDSDTDGTTDATSGSNGSSTIDCDTNTDDSACAIQVCVNNCLAGKTGENAQQCAISCQFH